MLGEYYMITGIGAFVCLVLAAASGLFGRTLRKIFPGPRVLLFHKTSALPEPDLHCFMYLVCMAFEIRPVFRTRLFNGRVFFVRPAWFMSIRCKSGTPKAQ